MHQIASKLKIIMVLTIVMAGIATSSTVRSRRLRHQRSRRTITSAPTQAQLEAEYSRNLNMLSSSQWICGSPKPRLVHINEAIHGEPHIESEMSWPIKTTVLHRCEDRSGCCLHDKSCTVTDSTTVTITFRQENTSTKEITYPQIQFSNHTRCECR